MNYKEEQETDDHEQLSVEHQKNLLHLLQNKKIIYKAASTLIVIGKHKHLSNFKGISKSWFN